MSEVTQEEADDRCVRRNRCYAAEQIEQGGRQFTVGAETTRPLCEACERATAQALTEAPDLYVRLRNATLIQGAATKASDYVLASKGSPLPLNAQALYLAEQLHWLLTTWEDEVRSIARLAHPNRGGKREGPQVVEAAALLAAHLTAWIAAPPTELATSRWTHNIEQSGADAASELIDWRSTARKSPGIAVDAPKAVLRYTDPCMYCGVEAVTHQSGEDLVQCQSCRATWDLELYPVKVKAFKEHILRLAQANA